MVKLTDVTRANAALNSSLPNPTAVVVGGTQGIGLAFLTSLTKHTTSPKIYIVGRNSSSLTTIITNLKAINSSGTYVPITTPDLTLVANAHDAASQIAQQEGPSGMIDLLYLSPGFLCFKGRVESPEGLDRATAIRYYSRVRIILDLLPLLERSSHARVIDALGGGQEGTIFPDDLALKELGHIGAMVTMPAASTYTTLAFEHLAPEHRAVSFVHTFPGVVRTMAYRRPEHLGPAARFLFNWVMFPLFGWMFVMQAEEVGERTLYVATSPRFKPARDWDAEEAVQGSDGKKGSGAYTVNEKCEVVRNDRIMVPLREKRMDEKLWEFTMREFERILGKGFGL
ncbi:hypothetical protein BR93DRAFT_123084 [Coniochaeta sp. PMI_546]|nr:hypothetical protein BR93DRAFT_123084 [Coniochaeta sp. PMI_546]